MANVGPGSNMLVLENCGGLVAGAVAERMGGYGTVCATYLEPHPKSIELVRSFNFTPEIMQTVTRAPLLGLLKMRKKQLEKENNNVETNGTMETGKDMLEPPVAEEPAIAEKEPEEKEAEQTNPPTSAIGAISSKATTVNPPFSGCIICNPTLQPKTALNALLPLLAPSACFAVWSQYLDPLVDAMNTLRSTGSAVNLMVQETWYRKQQVLPKRTHPLMNMNHGGGYMLSGTVTATGAALPMMAI
jgi:tRNA (adenine-N(1)-)-methyltransferase non-catalytic subunit